MSQTVHSGNTKRATTMAFRLFRQKNVTLSTQHWTAEAARHSLRVTLGGKNSGAKAVDEIGTPFNTRHLDETVRDLLARLDQRAGIDRLYLLVIASAHLESYLQDAVEVYVAHLGHRTADFRLNPVGRAMAGPVVDRSTVPDMIEYLEDLLGLQFGQDLTVWRRGYKLRCSAAHEGGQMSADTAKKLGVKQKAIGDWITLSWDELKSLMIAAHRMADLIDAKIASGSLRAFEVEWTLARWKRDSVLPPKNEVWSILHGLGIKVQMPKQRLLEKWLYA